MSEDNKGDNVTPESTDHVENSGAQESVNDAKNSVQYDTYKRVLGKLKSREKANTDLEERLKQLENEKLEAEGNKDQLIDSLKKEVMEHKTKLKSTVGTVATTQAMNAIVEEAVKAGCNSPGMVKKFLSDKIGGLEFDEAFNPDREQVRALIEEAKEAAPVLFGKLAPKIANHSTSGGGTGNPKPNLKKMSMDELMNTLGEIQKK